MRKLALRKKGCRLRGSLLACFGVEKRTVKPKKCSSKKANTFFEIFRKKADFLWPLAYLMEKRKRRKDQTGVPEKKYDKIVNLKKTFKKVVTNPKKAL